VILRDKFQPAKVYSSCDARNRIKARTRFVSVSEKTSLLDHLQKLKKGVWGEAKPRGLEAYTCLSRRDRRDLSAIALAKGDEDHRLNPASGQEKRAFSRRFHIMPSLGWI
jgi:hypothetical protein